MIFQIFYRDTGDLGEKIKGIDKLKAICLKLAIENNFEIVSLEGWEKYLSKGKKSPDGNYVSGWFEDVSQPDALRVCREILSCFNAELHETLSMEEWEERYQSLDNHLVPNGAAGEKYELFETYGEELDFVQKCKKENFKTIWTLVDDDEGKMYILPGDHFCNRLNYLITKIPWEDANLIEVQYCDEDFDADESADESYSA